MGIISILLGIIAFICSLGAGAAVANVCVEFMTAYASAFRGSTIPSGPTVVVGIVGIFGFIGLLIGMGLIMLGMTYNKVSNLERHHRHHRD